jgi:hypothetical protein
MRAANFRVVRSTMEYMLIEDMGPWDQHPTVTNDAENVIRRLLPGLHGRSIYYLDSEGSLGELVVCAGRFAGFAPADDSLLEGG